MQDACRMNGYYIDTKGEVTHTYSIQNQAKLWIGIIVPVMSLPSHTVAMAVLLINQSIELN